MYGTPQEEGTVTSSTQNIATSTLGTNTSSRGDKNTESSYDTTSTNLPIQDQTGDTSRTIPGMLISRLKEEDDVSCLSIKSGKLGPYAGGADTRLQAKPGRLPSSLRTNLRRRSSTRRLALGALKRPLRRVRPGQSKYLPQDPSMTYVSNVNFAVPAQQRDQRF